MLVEPWAGCELCKGRFGVPIAPRDTSGAIITGGKWLAPELLSAALHCESVLVHPLDRDMGLVLAFRISQDVEPAG